LQATDQTAQNLSAQANTASPKAEALGAVAERRAEKKVTPREPEQLQKNEGAGVVAGIVGGVRRLDEVDASAVAQKAAAPMAAAAAPPPATSEVARAKSESNRIEGRVTNPTGSPIDGASVMIRDSNRGAVTDKDGKFAIPNVSEGDHQVLVRRIGYAAESTRVTVNEPVNIADVVMRPQSTTISEVVVTSVNARDALEPQLQAIRTVPDTTESTYRLGSGVHVTLTETLVSDHALRDAPADSVANVQQRQAVRVTSKLGAMAAKAAPANNSISWIVANRRYTLTGPLPVRDLEAVKTRLLKQIKR
jgi:hypothetical protein